MARISTDRGRTADRIASINPGELHRAICDAAIAALRNGAPIEQLEGFTSFTLNGRLAARHDTTEQKRSHLTKRIADEEDVAKRARSNANQVDDEEAQAGFLNDAVKAHAEVKRLRKELDSCNSDTSPQALPDEISSELDFFAHALARLAVTIKTPNREFADAVQQVLTDIKITPRPDELVCDVEFRLCVPAADRVLTMGPIRTVVTNRAYPGTLPDDINPNSPRRTLVRAASSNALHPPPGGGHLETIQIIKDQLIKLGYSPLASGILVRSNSAALNAFIAAELWDEPIPDELHPEFITHIRDTYKVTAFRWNPRCHKVDSSLRQQLTDAVVARHGHATMRELIGDLAHTKINANRIAVYSTNQVCGTAPPWQPCVTREGPWTSNTSRDERSLRTHKCPHCTHGDATAVIRAPEVIACVLCPTCRRMPTADSPVFPSEYIT
jgi:hypothetical protein